MTTASAPPRPGAVDPGSFRDPDGRVLVAPEGVFRVLSPKGLADWRALAASDLFARHVAAGTMIGTAEAPDGHAIVADAAGRLIGEQAGVLRHDRIPVVSYPYEWTFSMLRDAALLQLALTSEGLDEGLMLKDATPYNVQWVGSQPVFIDVGSFERHRDGEPWPGYRQFCMLYLFPLLLQAHRGLDFHPLLRASVDGITPTDTNRIRRGRDLLRRGVLVHVALHARLERRYAAAERQDVERRLRRSGFKVEVIKANVRRLERVVRRLRWDEKASEWSDYRQTNTYERADDRAKETFVLEAVGAARRRLVWDIGANDGAYSRIAAEHADTVLAMDVDHLTVDRLYRELRESGPANVLPMVFDVVDPSPGLGWRGRERVPLEQRAKPDFVLALAVIHHVCIGRNIPVAELLDYLASLDAGGVLEFVERDDPMARRLLSRKAGDPNPDYEGERFAAALHERFDVRREQRLPSGTRVLYEFAPRGG